jgi:hypothetical protein
MWTLQQRQRLGLEHKILQEQGFTQFGVYHRPADDGYYASGVATSSSGRNYSLWMPIPSGYPTQRPPLYIYEPNSLRMANGVAISSLGVSHAMHTLTPDDRGYVQICHWRDARWHAGIVLQKVFLKALIWIEAYEQHLATGRDLAEFVRTMTEAA